MSSVAEKIIKQAAHGEPFTVQGMAYSIGHTCSAVRTAIQILCREGKVVKCGVSYSQLYKVVTHAPVSPSNIQT